MQKLHFLVLILALQIFSRSTQSQKCKLRDCFSVFNASNCRVTQLDTLSVENPQMNVPFHYRFRVHFSFEQQFRNKSSLDIEDAVRCAWVEVKVKHSFFLFCSLHCQGK